MQLYICMCDLCAHIWFHTHKMFKSHRSHCYFFLVLTPCICTPFPPSLSPFLSPFLSPSLPPSSFSYSPPHAQGVTIPSQRRYVQYYGHLIRNSLLYTPKALYLKGMRLEGIPRVSSGTYSKLNLCAYSMTNCTNAVTHECMQCCKLFVPACDSITVPALRSSFLFQHLPLLYGCTRQRCMPQRPTTTSEKQTLWQN